MNIMSESVSPSECLRVRSVRIAVQARVAVVMPAHEDLIKPVLSYNELTFRRNSAGRVQHEPHTKHVCKRHGDGLMIPIGCIDRVVRHFAHLGYEAQVEDRRNRTEYPCQIDESNVADAEAIVPGLAAAVASHIEGVFEVDNGNRRVHLLGAMCQLFHGARIFIACKTIAATHEIAAQLGMYLGGEVEGVHGWNWQSSCRVVCGTFGSLDRSDPADWHILVFADAFEGICEANRFARADYGHRRIYGLVDPRRLQSPRQQLLIETLAGPVIYRDPQCRQRPATELLAAFAIHASGDNQLLETARDRRVRLWNDLRRNQAIADVALASASGDEATLCEYGLCLQGGQSLSTLGPRPGVIVIVDSVDHGERLHRLLPGWHFFDGRPEQTTIRADGMSAGSWGIPPNSIVTAVAARTLFCFGGRVFLWASAGCVPFIPDVIGRSTFSHLLIDFWDDGNCHLATDTQQRLNAYRSIGCHVLGDNLDQREQALNEQHETAPRNHHRNTSRRHRRSQRPSV